MRAKVQVSSVTRYSETCESLKFHAVCKSGSYTGNGEDEDNTFALYTPSLSLEMTVSNPALIGKFNPGDKFYLDFSPVQPTTTT